MLKCWIFSFGLLTNNDTVNILCAKNEIKCKQRFIMLLLLSVVDVPYGEFWHRVNYEHAQHSQTNPILCEVSCSMFAALRFGCNPALLKCPVQNRISDFFKFFIKLNIGKKIRLKRFFLTITLRQILFFWIEAVTSSSLELSTGLISEKKNVSKSIGTFAAFQTQSTKHTH